MSSDRIEKRMFVDAPAARLLRALSNAAEFGQWFRVALSGQAFEPRRSARRHVTYPGYERPVLEIRMERVEPDRLLSFRSHPAAIERHVAG